MSFSLITLNSVVFYFLFFFFQESRRTAALILPCAAHFRSLSIGKLMESNQSLVGGGGGSGSGRQPENLKGIVTSSSVVCDPSTLEALILVDLLLFITALSILLLQHAHPPPPPRPGPSFTTRFAPCQSPLHFDPPLVEMRLHLHLTTCLATQHSICFSKGLSIDCWLGTRQIPGSQAVHHWRLLSNMCVEGHL